MDFYFTKLASALLLPPGSFFILIFVGFCLFNKKQKLALYFISTGTGLLFIFSLPIVSALLMSAIEVYPALTNAQVQTSNAQAIVVLGGGREYQAAEYGDDTVSQATLIRLRYGARLHRMTNLPILLTGGIATKGTKSEAELMAESLREDFKIEPQWQESKSRNTAENAKLSAEILHSNNINSIMLVSHAWHLLRAVDAYENQDIQVLPAPTSLSNFEFADIGIYSFIPNANSMHQSIFAMHEMLGYVWYQIRY